MYNLCEDRFPRIARPDGMIEECSGEVIILLSLCFLFFWFVMLFVAATRATTCLYYFVDFPENDRTTLSFSSFNGRSSRYMERDLIAIAILCCGVVVLVKECGREIQRCNISFCVGIIHCVLCMFICDLLAVQCFKENIHSCHPVLRVRDNRLRIPDHHDVRSLSLQQIHQNGLLHTIPCLFWCDFPIGKCRRSRVIAILAQAGVIGSSGCQFLTCYFHGSSVFSISSEVMHYRHSQR